MPADYVNKLARMFQDIKVSEDLNQVFKEVHKHNKLALPGETTSVATEVLFVSFELFRTTPFCYHFHCLEEHFDMLIFTLSSGSCIKVVFSSDW